MKKIIYKYLSFAVLVSMIACTGKAKEEVAESDGADVEWPLMDEFHFIMAESFHPYKDSANIEPAIAHAQEMASIADRWSTSELPAKVNNEAVKATLAELKNETAAFVQVAQSGDAAAIGSALTKLHDLFHKIQEAWYNGHDENGHEHGDHH